MRNRARLGLALAAWLLTITLGVLLGPALLRPAASPRAAGFEGPCVLEGHRSVLPRELGLMEVTTVTLGLHVTCEATRRPLHIVLVVDASREMSSGQLEALKDGLIEAIQDGGKVRLKEHPWVKIGVVSFTGASEAKALYPYLTNDPGTIAAALNNIETDGSICPQNPDFECGPSLGLREALNLLRTARGNEDPRQVVLLATAGDYKPVCDGIRQRATELATNGALLVTACAGNLNTCERGCLRDIVAHDRFYFRSPDWAYFDDVLGQIIDSEGAFNPVERLTVVDELPGALRFAGSNDPGIGVAPDRLSWDFDLSATGSTEWAITRTYRLQAMQCGQIQSSRGVTATLRYNAMVWGGQTRSYGLPNPVLLVPCPTATATVTRPTPGTPPTPTPTSGVTAPPTTTTPPSITPSPTTATRESTATAGTPATPTPPSRLAQAYLPIAANHACAAEPDARGWDVAILFDVSGSMGLPTGGAFGPQQRLAAARDIAANGLLGRGLRSTTDRVAVIQFGQVGDVLADLAPCCDSALAALDRLDKLSWSFPWNALERGRTVLGDAPTRPDARRAIILFTDLAPGDLGARDAELLQTRADALRADGIDLFAIGLGDGADADALARLTGAPDRVFLTRRLAGVDPPLLIGRSLRCGGG